jgi:hypothetical protein
MTSRRLTALAILALSFTAACDDDESPTGPTPPDDNVPIEGSVFLDEFAEGVTFQAFVDSKLDAVAIDESVTYRGSASLKVTVPGTEDTSGFFAGGAFTTEIPWDLSGYDALTFWARADRNASLNVAGLGNDNTGTSTHMVEMTELDMSGVWRKYVIPIPDPSALTAEGGLMYFAEGHENGETYHIWFDDIRFENLGAEVVRAAMASQTLTVEVGGTAQVKDLTATMDVGLVDVTVDAMPAYFTFTSSDESVAAVGIDGTITVLAEGAAEISGYLGSVEASGSVKITTGKPLSEPAPTPTQDPASVISLFSDAYDDVTVDTWSAVWDAADVEDAEIQGDAMKLYTNLVFAGIEFTSETIDAREMTHFHMNIWTPSGTNGGEVFKIKLVDFGADGAWSGGDDVEDELTFVAPPLESKEWVSLDIPLDDFANMTTRGAQAQLIISGDLGTVYVDNIYYYRAGEAPEAPSAPAPVPEHAAADVISLFSDPYTDVTVDTWSAEWDAADLEDTDAGGDPVKKYSNLTFAGIEFTSATIDASEMTHFRLDIWTPDETGGEAVFKVKLVDFGADGAWSGGDDVEHEVTLTAASTPAIGTGRWYVLDIPLADFTGLTTRAHLAQLIISGDPNTVFVDNVLFWKPPAPPAEPTEPAPTPTYDAANVTSLFSDAYDDVTVDTWSAEWDAADVEDTEAGGDAVKRYSNLVFAGIEFTSATVDASDRTHFRMDFWTPDETGGEAVFKVKLVDFGADGAWSGGDDVEHELTLTAESTPAIGTGNWYVLEMPLADFTGLTTRGHLAQMIISGDPDIVYLDNILFFKDVSTPTEAAPDPTDDAANVISLFSDAYDDVTVDTWSAEWDSAELTDLDIAGNPTKKYSSLVFAGIEFTSATIDATEMTHFRFDFWTPDPTVDPAVFKVKLVDFGADGAWSGGDDVEHEITLSAASTTPLATGTWVSFDVPLTEFTGLTTRGHLAQLIISGDPDTVFLDNIYFRK